AGSAGRSGISCAAASNDETSVAAGDDHPRSRKARHDPEVERRNEGIDGRSSILAAADEAEPLAHGDRVAETILLAEDARTRCNDGPGAQLDALEGAAVGDDRRGGSLMLGTIGPTVLDGGA